jgi:hypothetical protein
MKKSKKKIVKVLDQTPANDPKGGGHSHGMPPKQTNSGGGAKEQHHHRFLPR